MNLDDIIFVESLPKLDLHGYDRDTARVAIQDFINDNLKMKNEFINIIHGNGTGILRSETNKILKSNHNVLDYKTFYNNNGCTIVKLKFDK